MCPFYLYSSQMNSSKRTTGIYNWMSIHALLTLSHKGSLALHLCRYGSVLLSVLVVSACWRQVVLSNERGFSLNLDDNPPSRMRVYICISSLTSYLNHF